MRGRLDVGEKAAGRALFDLATGRAAERRVGRDEANALCDAMFGSKPFEERIRVSRIPHLEASHDAVFSPSVEDDDAPRAFDRHEVGEAVDEISRAAELARVQDVVAVEEIQGRLRHGRRLGGGRPRRAGAQRRR